MRLHNITKLFDPLRIKSSFNNFKKPLYALFYTSGISKKSVMLETKDNKKISVLRSDMPVWTGFFKQEKCTVKIDNEKFIVFPENKKHDEYEINVGNCGLTHNIKRWNPLALENPIIKELQAAERSIFSQHGEDGILDAIFTKIPLKHKFIVEFGAYDGITMSNSRHQILNNGWSALLMEADPRFYKGLHTLYSNDDKVNIKKVMISEDNINPLFKEFNVPTDFEILSIDIDSIDYYVWQAITEYQPKVVIIESNPSVPPDEEYIVSKENVFKYGATSKEGASILSWYKLAKQKGYDLAYVETIGVNLFFIHQSCREYIDASDITPELVYQTPQFGMLAGCDSFNGRGYPEPN